MHTKVGANNYLVASFSEAWIEMLKLWFVINPCKLVASFSEAWIEIKPSVALDSKVMCRLLLGGVD